MTVYTLAVDPGSRNIGAALFADSKLLDVYSDTVPAKMARVKRCYRLIVYLNSWFDDHDVTIFAPIYLAYESPSYFSRNGQGRPIQALERFVGMLEYWGCSQAMTVVGYNVSTVKTGVAGSPSASKEEVEAILRHEFNLHDAKHPSHVWDAIAVGVYHLRMMKVAEAEEASHGLV